MSRASKIVNAAILLSLNAACGGGDVRVVTNKEAGSTIEIAVGELVRFELPSTVERAWVRRTPTEPFVLVEASQRVDEDEWGATLSVSEFEGTGGGEQELVFYELPYKAAYTPSTPYPSMTFTVKVVGASREDEIIALYKGFTPVGGFGTSTQSGTPIRDLALFPSDLIAGVDGHLYVPSEERVWRIDTTARTGEIFIDKTRAEDPLPTDAVVTALDQRDSADWLLGLRQGDTNIVGWLRAGGTWEPIESWESERSIHRVRIAPDGVGWAAVDRTRTGGSVEGEGSHVRRACEGTVCGDAEPDAIEFSVDGSTLFWRGFFANSKSSLLVGRDKDHNPLLYTDDYPSGLQRLDAATLTPILLFEVVGTPGLRQTPALHRPMDFYASRPESTIGTGSSKYSWPAQKAAVAQTIDGEYWASGVRTVQEPPYDKGYNRGHGLYIHKE